MRRTIAPLAVLLCALSVTAGCGDDSAEGDSPTGASTTPEVVEVTFEGDSVTPHGDRIEIETGQEVRLEVTAEEAGEIHVHSDPEQQLDYAAGTTTVTIQPIDRPGTVEVESHELDQVIVQLEVH